MSFLEMPGEELVKLSDEELGHWLVSAWLAFQADRAGIARDSITKEWRTQIIEKSSKMDSDSVKNAPLESMFRKACTGDVGSAGGMLRKFLFSRASDALNAKYAAVGIAQTIGRKKGGRKAAAAKQQSAAAWHASCLEKARQLLKQGKLRRDFAGILATQFGVTPTTIRVLLKKAKLN